jgi:hypothetical protein
MKQTFIRLLFTMTLTACLGWSLSAQVTISQWNFNGTSATTVPGGVSAPTPSTGGGTASLAGGTSATFASGIANGGSTDPVTTSPENYGWNVTTFAAQSTGDKTRGVQFLVNTTGYENIQVRWDQRHSNTAPRHIQFQYTLNGGGNWTDLGVPFIGNAGDTWFNNRSIDLSLISGAADNADFGFRIVATFDPASGTSYAASNTSSSYATTGTWRFDMVTVSGTEIPALPAMRITEYMYSGAGPEFVEFTNVGSTPIDMTGWSYDDDSRTPGSFVLSGFGIVQPGESVIITEESPSAFRNTWNLCDNVKVLGPYTNNLGRNDEINLFDANGILIDRLTYGDQTFPGTIRTQNASGWVSAAGLGANDAAAWTLSTAGDAEQSYASAGNDIGSPGRSARATVAFDPCPIILAMRITEYMYSGANGEFVEFTNTGNAPVDMTGWSFDDNSNTPGSFSLSGFGTVQPGESVILTEVTAESFRTAWNLCDNLKVVGGLDQNLGRDDIINLYDANGTLVDRLAYGDQNFPGTIRTQNASGWVSAAGLSANDASAWTLSTTGDAEQSYTSTGNDIGSPGHSTRATETFVPCPPIPGAMRITEYMYSGANGEFVEFTNVGSTAIDMTGWSFDDNSNTAGSFDLSAFGMVQAGESVILTEADAATFRANWNLCSGIKIVGGQTQGLGRDDIINLYDSFGTLADKLAYGDQNFPGTIRTQNASGWVSAAGLGDNDASAWTLSTVGDAEQSYASTGNDIGSPGRSTRATVMYEPCPATGDAPLIALNTAQTNDLLDAGVVSAPSGSYAVSGVISDPTDPMSLYGLAFTLSDGDTPVGDLIFSVATNNTAVAPTANITVTGSGADRLVRIVPAGVGFATVTLTVSDGVNNGTFQILYAASAASSTPATTRWHTQASDASASVPQDADFMWVADDENQVLRLFRRGQSGLPVAGFDFSAQLELTDSPEADIEGAFRIGNRIYWTASHGNSSGGSQRLSRRRLFATDISGSGASATLAYVGRYDGLRDDLITWGDTNGYAFSATSNGTAPTNPTSFNIEGFTLAPDGVTAYLGFRAPRVPLPGRNKALIASIANFESWFNNGAPAGSPTIGAPIELDLGGRAIRSLECNANGCIIVAGNTDETGNFKLYTWSGNPADAPLPRAADLSELSVEALVELPASPFVDAAGDNLSVQLISDNGTRDFYASGQEAKDLPNNNHKKFRSDIVVLGPVDLASPMITMAAQNLNVECNGQGNSQQLNAWLANNGGAVASVACTPSVWTYEQTASSTNGYPQCFTYVFTITDECNRSAQTQAQFCINDNTSPSAVCFNTSLVFNGQSTINLNAEDLLDASDLCGIANVALSPSVISCEQVGQTVPVVVTVTDVAGNVSTCTAMVSVTGLPCDWSQNSNGIGCNNGSNVAFNTATSVWTATSTNCFYASPFTSDATSFAQRSLCGDGSITAQVTSINGNGWAGIVIRENSQPGAKKAQLMTNLSQFSRREFRTTTNGQAFPQQFPANGRYWLRIVRAGQQFTMYASPNGTAWFIVGTQNIAMNNCVEMGLVVTNYTANSTVTATFAGVAFSGSTGNVFANTDTPAASLDSPEWYVSDFSVYPNPTTGDISLDLSAYLGRNVRIEVFNAHGQLMQFADDEAVQNTLQRFDLSGYTNGLYLVKVRDLSKEGDAGTSRKVVLNR